jgi:glutamate racemase
MNNQPIGVFDSGLGGLTVVRALREQLPRESIVYLGDTARVPYGTRSATTVLRYARGCSQLLLERGIKLLVIACNTASAVALDVLAAELPIPVIGVVGPGASSAVDAATALRARGVTPVRIGVLGTLSTIESGAYPRAVAARSQQFEVCARSAPLLVPLVEEGWLDGDVPRLAVERYLTPLLDQQVRVVVLGCTHYPLLKPTIESLVHARLGSDAVVVDSAKATALSVAQALETRGQLTNIDEAILNLLVTDLPNSFTVSATRFLGASAPAAELVDIVPC